MIPFQSLNGGKKKERKEKVIALKLSSLSVYRFSLHPVDLTDTNAGAQTNMVTVSGAGFSDNHRISHP